MSAHHQTNHNTPYIDMDTGDLSNSWSRKIKDGYRIVVNDLKEFCAEIFPCFFTTPREYMGKIKEVIPITPTPEEYIGKCYHRVITEEDLEFQLIFKTIDFNQIEDRLRPQTLITIYYRFPDNQVVNIFPVQHHSRRFSTLKDILDEEDLEVVDHYVKASYVDDHLKRIDFVNSMEDI